VFTDLRGYTNFSETAEPEDVMTVLHELHEAAGPLVFEHHGTIAQFTGDGMMIIFNDPVPCEEPAMRAVEMATALRDRIGPLADQWRKRGHDLDMGIGVAMGFATCGRIGFEGRYEYTAVGTVVNLASRLCGVAKGREILVSQRVQAMVGDRVPLEPAGEFELKGFGRPVAAYSVTG
jgi:class 3 adenylate cyclase